MKSKGFTLIELMIVVVILGIIATIVLPAYQDYVEQNKKETVEIPYEKDYNDSVESKKECTSKYKQLCN